VIHASSSHLASHHFVCPFFESTRLQASRGSDFTNHQVTPCRAISMRPNHPFRSFQSLREELQRFQRYGPVQSLARCNSLRGTVANFIDDVGGLLKLVGIVQAELLFSSIAQHSLRQEGRPNTFASSTTRHKRCQAKDRTNIEEQSAGKQSSPPQGFSGSVVYGCASECKQAFAYSKFSCYTIVL